MTDALQCDSEKEYSIRATLYARCSTHDKGQDPELQLSPIQEYCQRRGFIISGQYVDKGVSGAKNRRPKLDRLMEAARRRQVDIIIVWKLAPLVKEPEAACDSIRQTFGTRDRVYILPGQFRLYNNPGKTFVPYHWLMAEFERELIRKRVKASLDNAQRKGNRLGGKPLPQATHDNIHKWRMQGLSLRKIASELGVSDGTV